MSLPPGVLAQSLIGTFPQFTLCDSGLGALLRSYLNPLTNGQVAQFIQWLQNNPQAATAGDVLNPPGTPSTTAVPLDASLVGALLPLLTATSSWIVDQSAFAGVAWTSQPGVTPGPEAPQPADGTWHLTTESPIGGLRFLDIAYAGTPNFTLSVVNDQPRHLGVYVAFTSAGVPVVPAGWTSRLPLGVPAGFESDTVKYVDVLVPNATVAGIAVDGTAQRIAFALPDNADAARLLFGGPGATAFSPVPDAAGVILTFVLDVFVPWVVQNAGQSASDSAAWFNALISDRRIIGDVIASGAFLIQGVTGTDAMFAALSDNLCAAMLGKGLSRLRSSITTQLGAPPDPTYSWVDQFAPAAGWAAQLVRGVLGGGLTPQYWVARTPAAITLDLSPSTTLELDVTLMPDPVSGIWPYSATGYRVAIAYAAGFSQILTGTMPTPQNVAPLMVRFGSVRNAGPIDVAVELSDAAGAVVAHGGASVSPALSGRARVVAAQITVADVAVTVGPATRYRCVARLSCQNGTYAWNVGASQSAAVGLSPTANPVPAVTSLNALTLQGDCLCLGYAWGAANQTIPACGGGAPLQNAYFIQNIGTALPAAQLKSVDCGLVATPLLAYAAATPQAGISAPPGCYLDTQGGGIYLRPVVFGPGSFDLRATTSVAQFPAQSSLTGLCLHPAGYAAAVSQNGGILQIVALAATPVPDAQAPMALSFGGAGSRIGLLGAPVAVAVTPDGLLLVLEQGNARVQAFDVNGNPVARFNGQAAFALQPASQPVYRDLAVSGAGLIYVLGSQNGGATVDDFFLDIYDADGALLAQTPGVNAGRIALAADQTLYTLDFDTITGPGGRTEPTLSAWRP